jgi:hypothetical protein
MLAAGMYETCQLPPDKLLAGVPVHHTYLKVGFNHDAGFQIIDDQPVVGGIKNASVLLFLFSGLIGSLA